MKMNRKELKIIIADFLDVSSRLLTSDFRDYNRALSRFVGFLKDTEVIANYINSCGPCEIDIDKAIEDIKSSSCELVLGSSDDEEIRNISAVIAYIVKNNIDVPYQIAQYFSSSRKYQDCVDEFNNRVILLLVNHIENYLTKISVDMGLDENIIYSITMQNGQVNIAKDNATISAENIVLYNDLQELEGLINTVVMEVNKCILSEEEKDSVADAIEIIRLESQSNNPRKSFIKTALSVLKGIKGTAEFGGAVASLVSFFSFM